VVDDGCVMVDRARVVAKQTLLLFQRNSTMNFPVENKKHSIAIMFSGNDTVTSQVKRLHAKLKLYRELKLLS